MQALVGDEGPGSGDAGYGGWVSEGRVAEGRMRPVAPRQPRENGFFVFFV